MEQTLEDYIRHDEVKVTKTTETINDIIAFCSTPKSMTEIMEHIGLKHRHNVKHQYIDPLIEGDFITMTIPEKPNSRNQKYQRALTGSADFPGW